MGIKALLAAAAVVVMTPLASLAAPLNNAVGTYDLSNINYESLAPRGIWTNGSGFLQQVGGGTDTTNLYDIENQGGTFTINPDHTARLLGTAVAIDTSGNVNTSISFVYDLSFTLHDDAVSGTQSGYCQFPGSTQDCSTKPASVDPTSWDYFTLDGSKDNTISFNSPFASVIYDITDRSGGTHKGQLGFNANALIEDGMLGYSMWFNAQARGQTGTGTFEVAGYNFRKSLHGDFNVYATLDPSITGVPLPAAGWLMIAAFGGLAAYKRRSA